MTIGSEPPRVNAGPELLHELFETTASRRPAHPAICFGEQTLTYAELNDRANQFARYLRSRNIGVGDLVAIYLEKSCDLFVSILGSLKVGAGYIPIDTKSPAKRVCHIVEDAGASLVITHQDLADIFTDTRASVLVIEEGREEIQQHTTLPLPASESPVSANDICYIIYTSGSTGHPKGVIIEHRNAVNFVRSLGTVYDLTERDRIYQGFSIAFDAAVEEVWAALSLGGTLIVAPDDVSRSALDAAEFINQQRITFFSTVPTFLAQITCDLPTLKLLVLGGEACPPELAQRWTSKGCRLLNTYGPTETTVVATAAELAPDRPVTIGKALPGYTTYVLDEEQRPVAPGETGELYIGGLGVGRGYMGRPELTKERFISNPFSQSPHSDPVLYRTHDLVRLEPNGDISFIGRIDGQIKIRGFRVELSEIEAVLLQSPAVKVAAATVIEKDGMQEIAAYAVQAEDAAIDREAITQLLRDRLPDYMVPKYFDVIDAMPVMTSGKVDRKQLPPPQSPLLGSHNNKPIKLPTTKMERVLLRVFERSTGIKPISVDDDFFSDLGGHSLMAAFVATMLRGRLNGVNVSVRDLYKHRTAQDLARHCEAIQMKSEQREALRQEGLQRAHQNDAGAVWRWQKWLCMSLQALSIVVYYSLATAPITYLVLMVLSVLNDQIALETAIQVSVIATFAYWPSMLFLSTALKWLVIGRYKSGRYPLWGFYYFRWWFVSRFQALSWSEMFVGTPLMSLYLRLMGAKIGKNCMIRTPWCTAFDLIHIGDNTSVGSETHMLGYRVEDGFLILGRVELGNDCFVGIHSCLGLDVQMGDGARLDDMSLLPDGTALWPGECRRGSPAERAHVEVPQRTEPRKRHPFLFGLIHLGLIYVMGYFLIFTLMPSVVLIGSALYYWGMVWGIVATFASVPLAIVSYIVLLVVTKWLLVGRIKPGVHSVESLTYLRHWFMDYLLNNTRAILSPLYATLFLPTLLRLLGAKIGPNVEFSTVMYVAPDLLQVGEGSFCADVCIVGGSRVHDGLAQIDDNKIGERSFIGNSAFLPGGVDVGDDCLIGVLSVPPAGTERVPDATRWLGSPAFPLPRTQQTVACLDAESLRRPVAKSRIVQLALQFMQFMRVLLADLISHACLAMLVVGFVVAYDFLPYWSAILLLPLMGVALMPRTQQAGASFSVEQTYRPTSKLRAARFFIELMRVTLPGLLGAAALVLFAACLVVAYNFLSLWATILLVPFVVIALSVLSIYTVASLKRLLIGTYHPLRAPLWSPFVWLNEVVNAIFETIAAAAMIPMMGTPFIVPCLRMMGCKIGKDVFLETTLFSEFDLVEVGDKAALNLGVTVQTHLFEDRILKTDRLKIGDHCSIGNMSVILYGTEMKARSSLKPLSLLMKGETLPSFSNWQGVPCQLVNDVPPTMESAAAHSVDEIIPAIAAE